MPQRDNESTTAMGAKQFSPKDVIQFFVYVIPIVIVILNMSNRIDNLTNTVNQIQTDKKEYNQDLKSFVQGFQAVQNQNTQDILLLKQQYQLQILANQKK